MPRRPWRIRTTIRCVLVLVGASVRCADGPPCIVVAATSRPAGGDAALAAGPVGSGDGTPYFASTAVPTDPQRYPYNHAASIVQAGNGDLLVAWGAGSAELAPDTVILLSRRRAGERDWSPPVVAANKLGRADANPVLFLDDAGVVHLFHVEMFGETFCLGRVMVRTSTDHGETWSQPRPALDAVCVMVRNRPIILRDGTWLLPAYVQGVYASQFWRSVDRGRSWQSTAALMTTPSNNLQPAVAQLADGSLYALMRSAGGGRAWEGRSADCGRSWSLTQRDDLANPNSGLDLVRLATGELVAAFNDSATDRTPLTVALSSDSGKTWPRRAVIEAGPPQLSYPSMIQSADGVIHVVYSHRLTHIQHVELNTEWMRR